MNTGLGNTDVRALAIDPAAPSTLYAGTWGGGVFKSTNSGGTWTAINAGLTDPFISALAIDPSAPATLYAGTASGFSGGVFKSTDGGASWTAINAGLSTREIGALAIDPSTPARLYAGTWAFVFKSTDAGANWTIVSTGLTDDYLTIYSLAIDPSTPATLYALTNGGIFKSINGGTNWTEKFVKRFFLPWRLILRRRLLFMPPAAVSSRAPTAGETGRKSVPAGQRRGSGHRSFRPEGALCRHIRGRRLQEHERWQHVDPVQRGPRQSAGQCPGHRSCGACQTYAGTGGGGVFGYESVIEPTGLIPRQQVILTTPRRRPP